MKTTNQICRENARTLGGFDNAQIIAEAVANNDLSSFLDVKQAIAQTIKGRKDLLRKFRFI